MKKWLLIISATVICVAAAFLYFFSLTPKGDTITSRESILNTAISKGNEWTIAKELELGGYIVSGAYSTDNKSTLAIFEPTGNGDYKFSTSTNRNSDEIIVGGVAINGEWYDLIWFMKLLLYGSLGDGENQIFTSDIVAQAIILYVLLDNKRDGEHAVLACFLLGDFQAVSVPVPDNITRPQLQYIADTQA